MLCVRKFQIAIAISLSNIYVFMHLYSLINPKHLSTFCSQFPEFIASFFSRLSWPSSGSSSPPAPARTTLGNIPPYAGRQVEASSLLCIRNSFRSIASD